MEGEHYYIKEQVKQKVFFKKHDLLKDTFGQNYSLIICRNVIIYFTSQAQNQLYFKFYHSLAPEVILFTGGSAIILNYAEKGFGRMAPWVYKKSKP
jgi:chemotaxis protein methyltransferase CheR